MGILSKSFSGGYDPREESARGVAAARAAAEYWTGRPAPAEPERPEPVAIYKAPCGERREIDSWETVDWLLSFPGGKDIVTLLQERPAPEPASTDEPTTATPSETPAETTPPAESSAGEPPAKDETPFTHELVLVGRKGMEVLEPVSGRWESWSPASVADHLQKHPHHKVRFFPNRQKFYNGGSKIRTMTAKQAVDFLRNSGRL